MIFADLHSHILFGVDDGAKTEEESMALIGEAYRDGTRALCLTPHCAPTMFEDNYEKSETAFRKLKEAVKKEYPDLELFLGHELGYFTGCVNTLSEGRCRTLAGSRFVLVDFPEGEDFSVLEDAADAIMRAGYRMILAHAERYRCLNHKLRWLEEFVASGGFVQLNASSAVGGWGAFAAHQWKKIVKMKLCHFIASDAHNLTSRPPQISVCLPVLSKLVSPEEIEELTYLNPLSLLRNGEL